MSGLDRTQLRARTVLCDSTSRARRRARNPAGVRARNHQADVLRRLLAICRPYARQRRAPSSSAMDWPVYSGFMEDRASTPWSCGRFRATSVFRRRYRGEPGRRHDVQRDLAFHGQVPAPGRGPLLRISARIPATALSHPWAWWSHFARRGSNYRSASQKYFPSWGTLTQCPEFCSLKRIAGSTALRRSICPH
jgi:hypothetical protein